MNEFKTPLLLNLLLFVKLYIIKLYNMIRDYMDISSVPVLKKKNIINNSYYILFELILNKKLDLLWFENRFL